MFGALLGLELPCPSFCQCPLSPFPSLQMPDGLCTKPRDQGRAVSHLSIPAFQACCPHHFVGSPATRKKSPFPGNRLSNLKSPTDPKRRRGDLNSLFLDHRQDIPPPQDMYAHGCRSFILGERRQEPLLPSSSAPFTVSPQEPESLHNSFADAAGDVRSPSGETAGAQSPAPRRAPPHLSRTPGNPLC